MGQAEVWRLSVFLVVVSTMALWEYFRPFRQHTLGIRRIRNNLALMIFNTLVLRLLSAAAPVTAAVYVDTHQFGIMHWLAIPLWLNIVVTLILFDLVIYWQHRLMHAIPVLWKLHGLHHTDPELDFSSAGRFHPIEIVLSMAIKTLIVFVIGASPIAVIIFESLLNAMATFNHANIKIPEKTEKWLRRLIVTPTMHRIHHSVLADETNSNFGFNFSVWDRVFSTYRSSAKNGDDGIIIGLKKSNSIKNVTYRFLWMLAAPFKFQYNDES